MTAFKFTLPVRPATKKNSGQIITVGGYPRLIPSKQYLQFEKDCQPYFKRVLNQVGQITYPVNLKAVFYTETKRKIDLPNLLNALDDAMVKSTLIIDDNRDIIAAHDGSRVYCDKNNPRIEIEIMEIPKYTQLKDTQSKQQSLFNKKG